MRDALYHSDEYYRNVAIQILQQNKFKLREDEVSQAIESWEEERGTYLFITEQDVVYDHLIELIREDNHA